MPAWRGGGRSRPTPHTPMKKAASKKAAGKKAAKHAMTKRATARKAGTVSPAPGGGTRATKKAAAAGGPVTLEEARVLAGLSPKNVAATGRRRAAGGARRAAAAPVKAEVTAAAVAKLRLGLEKAEDAEMKRRVDEYTATLKVLKARGVKGLAEAAETLVAAAAARQRRRAVRRAPAGTPLAAAPALAGQPLQILAEGDSWFDYGVPGFGGSIVPRLEKKIRVPILNLAKGGDVVEAMLGVKQRQILKEHLVRGCPAGGPWDVLLFSGGGNDIVGDRMAVWMREYDSAIKPEQHIHQPYFKPALDLLKAGYQSLIALRDECSPGTHLIFQAYDHAIPDGRGVCWKGPWLEPTFKLRRFPKLSSSPAESPSFKVVQVMLGQFARMLEGLASTSRRITVINGQGTLPLHTSSWHNELHPSKTGFETHADLFHQKLRQLFPGRVL